MDLLGGYASGSDDGGDGAEVMNARSSSEARPASVEQTAKPAALSPLLPPQTKAADSSKMKLAAPASRKSVLFRVPLDPSVLADSDEDEDRPAKKVKVDKAKGLMDVLPAPKHSMPAPRRDHFARAQANAQSAADAKSAAPVVAAAPDTMGNEAFRIPMRGSAVPPSAHSASTAASGHGNMASSTHPDTAQAGFEASLAASARGPLTSSAHANGNGGYDRSAGYPQDGQWQQPQPAAGPAQPDWGDPSSTFDYTEPDAGSIPDPMQQAYMAENVRGFSGGSQQHTKDPFAAAGINFVEVKGSDLREGNRAARDAQQGIRGALGAGYEARLRREAGPDPDKKSRRKHQITSLFHAAKMKELEQFEQRAQGIKTKAETQAKYGW